MNPGYRAGTALLATLLLSFGALGADADALPVRVEAGHRYVQYIGRFSDSHSCAWGNSTIVVKVDSPAVNALFTGRNVHVLPVIDGVPGERIRVDRGVTRYRVADGLAPGSHVIELVRMSEALFGVLEFQGFELAARGRIYAPPKRASRRIELIGDSITAGYGNEAAKPSDGFKSETSNGYLTYGPMAARDLDAEVVTTAWSGKGIYRNRGSGDRLKDTMQVLAERTIPQSASSKWDRSEYVPNVIVINLGTNDWHKGAPPREEFVASYVAYLKKLRAAAPKAVIFVTCSPMVGGKALKEVESYLDDVVRRAADRRISYLGIGAIMKWPDEHGGHHHPKVSCHRRMADRLVEAIRKATGWR